MNKQLRLALTILIMATIMAIGHISFPIAYFVGWIMCIWYIKKTKLKKE